MWGLHCRKSQHISRSIMNSKKGRKGNFDLFCSSALRKHTEITIEQFMTDTSDFKLKYMQAHSHGRGGHL